MTVIEAMGTGLPIVATAVGGVLDMLENNVNALLCEVDAEKLAECFEKYYLDEKLRECHGKAALERSKAFSAEEMARKYLAIYKGTELV
jgi:glycosyltransferase involved in cell wall biosynthesis